MSEPLQAAPDVGSGCCSGDPRGAAHQIDQTPARLAHGAHLLCAQAHAELRASCEAARRGYVQREKRAQRLLSRVRGGAAWSAVANMSREPFLFRRRDAFDALFRDERFGASVGFVDIVLL